MKLNVVLLFVTALLAFTAPVSGHHPMAVMYLEDRTQAIEGTLVQFVLRNPHSFVYLETPGENGQAKRWTIEWLAGLQLNRQGVTGDTLKFGDHLVITGFPARDPQELRLSLRTIARPRDGWKWRGTFE
jgi:hypothetical protein